MSENKIVLRPEQVKLIEELAHVYELGGLQPAIGKILALLTVSDEIELTFEQIKDTLALSKAAISQALNQLMVTGKIQYKTKIGDRKRYFHLNINNWDEQVMEHFRGLATLLGIYKKIIEKRNPETVDFNNHLVKSTEFLELAYQNSLALYQKYREEKG